MIRELDQIRDRDECIDILKSIPDSFTPEGIESCERDLQNNRCWGYVADVAGAIRAFVLCRPAGENWTEVRWIAVHPHWRNLALGRQLMDALGPRNIMLLSRGQTEEVMAFYSNMGFAAARPFELIGWDKEAWLWMRIQQ